MVERLLACNEHLWNSGIFLLPVRQFIDELAEREPEIMSACRKALAGATRDLDFMRLEEKAFEACPSISVDYAIMEKTDRAVVVSAAFDWSDIGSWSALWTMSEKDEFGNVVVGDAIMEDASGCYVRGDGPLVAALGVDDLVIAASPDVVLVTRRNRDQDVGRLVERLKANGHRSATQTQSVHRPCWAITSRYMPVSAFRSSALTVNPGAKLSLQKHFHPRRALGGRQRNRDCHAR